MTRSNRVKHLSPLLVVSILAILFTSCWMFASPKKGKLIESWDFPGKTLKLRVEAYDERNAIVGGAYYDFRSAPVGSENWQTVMTFRHDDPVPIPRKNVRFVDEHVAYAFMGWKYAVTTDSGKTWSIWDAGKDLPHWQCCNYELIQNVVVGSDGSGKMSLKMISGRSGEVPDLQTRDFGRHWAP